MPGAHLAFSAGQYTLQLGNTPAFALWPLSSQADAEAAAGRLRPHVDAALGSGLLSALAAQVLPDAPPIAALLPLSRDPAATLRERLLSPGALELLVGTIAGWLGRPSSAGRTPLVDGVLDIVVAALADGVRLEAATGAGGWSPAAGLRVELGAGLALTPRGAKPSGRLVLGIDLPAAVQEAWQRLDLALAVDAGGRVVDVVVDQPGAELGQCAIAKLRAARMPATTSLVRLELAISVGLPALAPALSSAQLGHGFRAIRDRLIHCATSQGVHGVRLHLTLAVGANGRGRVAAIDEAYRARGELVRCFDLVASDGEHWAASQRGGAVDADLVLP